MERIYEDYIVIKAEENGVNIIDTEKLDKGENTSAIKIRGKARILSRHGEVYSGE